MLKKVLIGLVAVVALVCIVGLFLPKTYSLSRSIEIEAPPAKVFELVNSFQNWPKWDPWSGRDKTLKHTYEGTAGVGHIHRWKGDESGEGTAKIIKSVPGKTVALELDFGMGGAPPIATFELTPRGKTTLVTWSMEGTNIMQPIGNYLGLMMDGMVGADYERGLANLERVAERP